MRNEQSNDDDKRDSDPYLNRTGTGRSVDLCVVMLSCCHLPVHTRSEHIPKTSSRKQQHNI
jgi:hypothetical protein